MTATNNTHHGLPPTAGHPNDLGLDTRRSTGTVAIAVAATAIALKLPQAGLALVFGAGVTGWIPPSSSATGIYITLAWVAFSLALLLMRKWLGAVSAAWFCLVSLISGGRLLALGFPIWGGWQVATALVALIAIGVAIARGAFKGSRW